MKWPKLRSSSVIIGLDGLPELFIKQLDGCAPLGIGELNSSAAEKVMDRYATVMLCRGPDVVPLDRKHLAGRVGTLKVQVLEIRPSAHCGDGDRGQFPTPPKVGEIIVLGVGRLFFEKDKGGDCVGVEPTEDQSSECLDPHAFYRAHGQIVRLLFCP